MKIICQKDILLKSVSSVINAIPWKSTLEILGGILLQTNDNELKLTTYDLEIGIESVMECTVVEHGNTVVMGTMLGEIIRKLPDSEISLTLTPNNMLKVECEGVLYQLATMKAEEFPELPVVEVENTIELEQNLLKTMIKKTIFAASTEKNKPTFMGCLFEVANNKLNIVAVDGFRLAFKTVYLQNQDQEFKAIIPAKTLNEVIKIITESFDKIKIGLAKNQAIFEFDNCKIVTRTLDGEFLNYKSAIPANWETRIKCSKNLLQEAFERISLITLTDIIKDKKYPVKINIDIGKITMTCFNQKGQGKEEIFVETEGKNLEIALNPKYMLDCLKAIDEEEIYLELGSKLSPCLIKSVENNDFIYMVLPMRV